MAIQPIETNPAKNYLCGCTADDPCEDHEQRCEVGVDIDATCGKPATQVVREPYTPASFKVHCCDECARSLIHQGYIAPMSLARIRTAIKESYNSAPVGSWEEKYYYDGLLRVVLIQRNAEQFEIAHLLNPAYSAPEITA